MLSKHTIISSGVERGPPYSLYSPFEPSETANQLRYRFRPATTHPVHDDHACSAGGFQLIAHYPFQGFHQRFSSEARPESVEANCECHSCE